MQPRALAWGKLHAREGHALGAGAEGGISWSPPRRWRAAAGTQTLAPCKARTGQLTAGSPGPLEPSGGGPPHPRSSTSLSVARVEDSSLQPWAPLSALPRHTELTSVGHPEHTLARPWPSAHLPRLSASRSDGNLKINSKRSSHITAAAIHDPLARATHRAARLPFLPETLPTRRLAVTRPLLDEINTTRTAS